MNLLHGLLRGRQCLLGVGERRKTIGADGQESGLLTHGRAFRVRVGSFQGPVFAARLLLS